MKLVEKARRVCSLDDAYIANGKASIVDLQSTLEVY